MRIEYPIVIDWLKGNFSKQFYCRLYKGKTIVQRRPDRSNHVKTQAELENQKRFAALHAGKHKNTNPLTPPTAGE